MGFYIFSAVLIRSLFGVRRTDLGGQKRLCAPGNQSFWMMRLRFRIGIVFRNSTREISVSVTRSEMAERLRSCRVAHCPGSVEFKQQKADTICRGAGCGLHIDPERGQAWAAPFDKGAATRLERSASAKVAQGKKRPRVTMKPGVRYTSGML